MNTDRPGLAALIAGLVLCALPAQQKQTPKPAKPRLVEVTTFGLSTRAPSPQEVDYLGLEVHVRPQGQIVTGLAKDGAAARAGIAAGDVILQLDRNEVFSHDDITDFARVKKPGGTVQVRLRRAESGKVETVPVALGSKKVEAPPEPRLAWQFASLAQLGAALARAKRESRLVFVGLSGAET